ncbi:unnamed protein product [Blumeria hordei]|uniref:CID domain-containing protein n=2 Tax=Blumeria hordei TaxID=2867405 RepID=A0A383UK73_BLUHO|nr:small nuclear ribonucleoprotein [Blumeria hordei DH14]SZE99716.1 unnamed protein product [Blumeria hordei]
MGIDKTIAEFPNVENKLQAPTRKSLFERQRADAEAKRQREEAETQAVYEDFLRSFDDDDQGPVYDRATVSGKGSSGLNDATKKHPTGGYGFANMSNPALAKNIGVERGRISSGPGSLGPPPPNLSRKRPFENVGFQQKDREKPLLAFDDFESDNWTAKKSLNLDNDESRRNELEEERAAPKPTVRLSSMPPGTSPALIKSLIPTNLVVDNVKILPPAGPGAYLERKSMSAIVTFAKDTAANDVDTAINGLQNRYMGYGYYLSIHRHLSSAALSSANPIPSLYNSTPTSQPFGAKPVDIAVTTRNHIPPAHQGRFAPPTSYETPGSGRSGPLLHVPVQAPSDIKDIKLIHKVVENIITYGPEFEALLMSRPEVQREEKWAWLWDARCSRAAWYRWRLWEVITGIKPQRGQGKYFPLFEGFSAWKQPNYPLAYEHTIRLDEFVSDSEYNSSDEEDSGDEGPRRPNRGGAAPSDPISSEDAISYLNPLEKAKLTHLLARLPTTTGTLRKGDVARVTAFAISHAGRGSDEVVHMIISNVERPFSYTSANPNRKKDKEKNNGSDEEEESDTSAASLIGLYLISDILSSSSTSGVRHSWKYRQLFEVALKQRKVFEGLGRMERKMNWGRLRAEKWKRSVENILKLWEGWCVFPQESQESFSSLFDKPPLTTLEKLEKAERENKEKIGVKGKGTNKWKAVEAKSETTKEGEQIDGTAMDIDHEEGSTEGDFDGEPMSDDDDLDGTPMDEGEPVIEDQQKSASETQDSHQLPSSKSSAKEKATFVSNSRLKRPRAVDMFADSDDDE